MEESSERLKLLIAYDGRPFCGWQSQANGDAIQDRLEKAILQICGVKSTVHGSGRTDAGVHAIGQVAHADVPKRRLSIPSWLSALNAYLPAEIRVMKVSRAKPEFHARFDARGKIYVYRIWNGPAFHPLELGRAWHVPVVLELSQLQAGIAMLTGRHDFAGFAANRGHPPADTVRTIHQIGFRRRAELLTLTFEGDGFLYKMVRLLTGTLIRVAQGKADLAFIQTLLQSHGKTKSHFAAPAEGLYLKRVLY